MEGIPVEFHFYGGDVSVPEYRNVACPELMRFHQHRCACHCIGHLVQKPIHVHQTNRVGVRCVLFSQRRRYRVWKRIKCWKSHHHMYHMTRKTYPSFLSIHPIVYHSAQHPRYSSLSEAAAITCLARCIPTVKFMTSLRCPFPMSKA